MMIEVEDEARFREELAPWQQLQGGQLRLQLGPQQYPANLFTCRPEDRCVGTTHWVQFVLDNLGRRLLGDRDQVVRFTVNLPEYRHESEPLSEEARQSLLEDLETPDRAAA
jgi:hypothetical protein